jgi:hypothetical protein
MGILEWLVCKQVMVEGERRREGGREGEREGGSGGGGIESVIMQQ